MSRSHPKAMDQFQEEIEEEFPQSQNLRRGLLARHLQMISIGGTIGTGLFLTIGDAISSCGPVGALIGYTVIGSMVWCLMSTLGEMSTYLPVSGAFNHYAARFIDPALGHALGWNYWLSWVLTVAVELFALAQTMNYWLLGNGTSSDALFTDYPLIIAIPFLIVIFLLNCTGVKVYGEVEYWMSLIKVIAVVLYIILSILINTGLIGENKHRFFDTWTKAPFGENDTLAKILYTGIAGSFISAGFSFQGTELVAIAAGETEDPRKNVPKAINNIFWRISCFYILCVGLTGLNLSGDDLGDGGVAKSPFTQVFLKASLISAANVVNFVILSALLSAANSSLYSSSRIICALAREGKAPSILGRVSNNGTPFYALLVTALSVLAFVMINFALSDIFNLLYSITSVIGFMSWAGIAWTGYRFRRAYLHQGRNINDLDFISTGYPWTNFFSFGLCIFVIVFYGVDSINYNSEKAPKERDSLLLVLFKSWGVVGIFLINYLSYKFIKGTSVIPLSEVDLDTGRVDDIKSSIEPQSFLQKIGAILA